MATRTLRTCKVCRRASDSDYCPAHEHHSPQAFERDKGKSAASRGYGHQWRKQREQVLRDQPVCAMCKRRLAEQVDHIKPLAAGGSHERENLQGLCVECHRTKTARDGTAGRTNEARNA
jgi:5-methylcytosine-specific restriction protein A